MFAMEQQFEEAEADARQEFHSLRDEIKNKVGYIKNLVSDRFKVHRIFKCIEIYRFRIFLGISAEFREN